MRAILAADFEKSNSKDKSCLTFGHEISKLETVKLLIFFLIKSKFQSHNLQL